MYSGEVIPLLCPALSGGTCRKSECDCSVPGTSKHRHCDTTKTKLVRNIPETFKGLGLSQQTAFCPQKAMLAGILQINFSFMLVITFETSYSMVIKYPSLV